MSSFCWMCDSLIGSDRTKIHAKHIHGRGGGFWTHRGSGPPPPRLWASNRSLSLGPQGPVPGTVCVWGGGYFGPKLFCANRFMGARGAGGWDPGFHAERNGTAYLTCVDNFARHCITLTLGKHGPGGWPWGGGVKGVEGGQSGMVCAVSDVGGACGHPLQNMALQNVLYLVLEMVGRMNLHAFWLNHP